MGGVMATPVPDAVLVARAYLSRVAEPASIPVWDWVRRHGPVAAAESIRTGVVPSEVAQATQARRTSADPSADLEAAARHDIRLVVPEGTEWPHFALAAMEAVALARLAAYRAGEQTHRPGGELIPPLALWVKGAGELALAAVRSVAIVGSRAASSYGEHVTAELAFGLARRDVVVVSGGAVGVDAMAHRAALAAEGSTTIVSAGGVDRPYPSANAALFDHAAAAGLVLSESPPGSAPHRHRFLTRNRLIAALATGTVVTEAAVRSGALNTASHCARLGRPLMAVPGPVTSAVSAGCHRLLRDDDSPARLVTSVDDILAVVGSMGEGLEPAETAPDGTAPAGGSGADDLTVALDRLDPVARRVFDGLPARRAASEDELALRSGVSPIEVMRALPALRLAGVVEAGPGGVRISARYHAGRANQRLVRPSPGAAP
jgi:DNA processing protein